MTEMILYILGLLYIAVGIRAVLYPGFFTEMIEEYENSAALTYLTGVIVVAVCAVLLKYHNDWSGWRVGFATFVLWAGLIKGFSLLAFPRAMFGIWNNLPAWLISRASGFVIILAGAALVWWSVQVY